MCRVSSSVAVRLCHGLSIYGCSGVCSEHACVKSSDAYAWLFPGQLFNMRLVSLQRTISAQPLADNCSALSDSINSLRYAIKEREDVRGSLFWVTKKLAIFGLCLLFF